MTEAWLYRLHGLVIRSEVPLPEEPLDAGVPDLDVVWGEPRTVPEDPPDGEVVGEAVTEERRWYTITSTPDGYVLRFHRTCEVHLSADLRRAVCAVDTNADPGVASVLVAGTLMAFVLEMSQHCVLHASAVQIEGQALAIVGASGMGKTTAAALLCLAGAPLVTDDVLRVDFSDEVTCHRGAGRVRLRSAAMSLVELSEDSSAVTTTADLRLSWAPAPTDRQLLTLGAVMIPRPLREATKVELRPVSPADAMTALLRFPRVYGMRRPDDVRRQFGNLATLSARVPVLSVDIPWGPPFSRETAVELHDALAASLDAGLPA